MGGVSSHLYPIRDGSNPNTDASYNSRGAVPHSTELSQSIWGLHQTYPSLQRFDFVFLTLHILGLDLGKIK